MLLLNVVWACVASCYCVLTMLEFSTFLSNQNTQTTLTQKYEKIRPPILTDDGEVQQYAPVWDILYEIVWNVFVCLLFLVQHTFMASQWWKGLLEDLGIVTCQRALYVLGTSWAIQFVMTNTTVIELPALWYVDTTTSSLYWLIAVLVHVVAWVLLYSTCLIMDVPEMIGLKQVYYQYLGCERPLAQKSAATRRLYTHMRHGGATCLLVILWFHPMMTATRVVTATMLTLYLTYGFTVYEQDYVYLKEQIVRKRVTLRIQRTKTIELLQ